MEDLKTPWRQKKGSLWIVLNCDDEVVCCFANGECSLQKNIEMALNAVTVANECDSLIAMCRQQMDTATLAQDVLIAQKIARPLVLRFLRDIAETENLLHKKTLSSAIKMLTLNASE